MQSAIINIKPGKAGLQIVESVLSFRPFLRQLKEQAVSEKIVRKGLYEYIIKKFEEYPAVNDIHDPETAIRHSELLDLIFTSLSPLISGEDHILWALSTPVPGSIFYSTDAFSDFFAKVSTEGEGEANKDHTHETIKYRYEHIYSLILEKLYGYKSSQKEDIIYSHLDQESGLMRYFKIEADTRFIDIKVKGELPVLDITAVERFLNQEDVYKTLADMLPPHLFRFEGFSVLTFSDVTEKYALENIRQAIINHATDANKQNNVVTCSLQSLADDRNVRFGLLPFLKLNGKLVFDNEHCSQSVLLRCNDRAENMNEAFGSLITSFMAEPKPYFFGSLKEDKQDLHPVLKMLQEHGVSSYGLLPVFYNNQLSGVLEIYSSEGTISFEQILSRLELAIPLIAQILQNMTDEFKAKIEKTIKSKFTSLQPSVQWKFNEAAWEYLKAKRRGAAKVEIASISFKQVYPLYGAIDIRDSTIARNAALRQDNELLLRILIDVLADLKKLHPLTLVDELIFECEKWLLKISEGISANDEMLLSLFLENQADPFLSHFGNTSSESAGLISRYQEASHPESGVAFAKRRELEASIQHVNVSINAYFENVQTELQTTYPCYFEKFRTDGVEYDIYIGQSIAPDLPFNSLYLRNLRLWQVKSMVEIARLTHALLEKTAVQLDTTQLIFVHSNPIDISFRNDERRFDVEGAYNIRYEIIKKRIDKVNVKGTANRLTQPGKIAIVYYNNRESEEYIQYISYLQQQNMLHNDLEYLELEELQGVSGLKALRVGVAF